MAQPDELDERALAGILDALATPLIVLDRDGLVLHTNDAADDHFAIMEGDPWLDLLSTDERAAGEAALEAARGNAVAHLECRRGGRDWRLTVQPTHAGLVVTAQEHAASPQEASKQAVQAAAERSHLAQTMAEMEHRIGNLLSMVPAIVKLSLRRATDMKSARDRVVSRVAALAAAHSAMLTSEAIESGVSLDAMVGAVLHAHGDAVASAEGDGRFVTSGPPVHIATRGSNAVALALHELASNAVEYGALSRPGGRVRLAWAIEDSARDLKLPQGAQSVLRLLWSETGGPTITTPPKHRGFGTDVIDRLILSQGGAIEREWLLHGLAVTIDLPLYELGREPKFSRDMSPPDRPLTPATDEAATRIVEHAVNAVGGPVQPAAPLAPVKDYAGPSEADILSQVDRIIANASD